MSRGIIFDLDGTLADTLPDIAAAVNVGMRAFSLPDRPAAEIAQWVGSGLPSLCERAVAAAGANIPVDRLIQTVRQSYREHLLDGTRAYPGITELLAELARRGAPMAVLTNKPHELTVPIVAGLFGRSLFLAVEGYRQEDRKKPDPRSALKIVAEMHLSPEDVLMVGDSATDVTTALNAGMIPVGVTWGYRGLGELVAAGSRHIIETPGELLSLL